MEVANPLEDHIDVLVEDIGLEKLLDLCDFDHREAMKILVLNGYVELPYEWSLKDEDTEEEGG